MRVVGDPAASRQFLSKYLELAGSMNNAESEKDAWTQLGGLLSGQEQMNEASECFSHAFQLSMGLQAQDSNHARAMMGVTKGEQMLKKQMHDLGINLRQA